MSGKTLMWEWESGSIKRIINLRDGEELPDGRIIKYMGRCAACNNRVYGFLDDNYPDPRGIIPSEYTASYIESGEYSEGQLHKDVIVCFECGNNKDAYNRVLFRYLEKSV